MVNLYIPTCALLSTLCIAQAASTPNANNLCPDGAPALNMTTTIIDGLPAVYKVCTMTDALINNVPSLKNRLARGDTQRAIGSSNQNQDITPRQSYVNTCGAPCTTLCYTPAGGGPNPNDCAVWAKVLRVIGFTSYKFHGGEIIFWSYASCQMFAAADNPGYPRTTEMCVSQIADIINYLAFNCQANQNASGGECRFYNNRPQVGVIGLHHS